MGKRKYMKGNGDLCEDQGSVRVLCCYYSNCWRLLQCFEFFFFVCFGLYCGLLIQAH